MIDADGAVRTQPALRTLQINQRRLLTGGSPVEHGLRDGFPTRRAAVEWYQRAVVRTFGFIATDWGPKDLIRDKTLVCALVTGGERDRIASGDPPSAAVAEHYRTTLERNIVLPACNQAFNALRRNAGEYLQDGDVAPGKVDPQSQDHVAMRPTVQRKDVEQARALNQLWGGFADETALRDWIHDLDEPTNGAIDRTLAARICRDQTAREHLVRDEQIDAGIDERQARAFRERVAIDTLLPAFVTGIRRIDGGELVQQQSTGLSAPHG